jgi:prepilin signal peptidase PulO-like enzyme (type II secretory pathway)
MLWALFLGVVAGGVGAATALARRKRTLAYGPYLVAGGLVALLLPDSSP